MSENTVVDMFGHVVPDTRQDRVRTRVGEAGEYYAAYALSLLGVQVLPATGVCAAYDLVADVGGRLLRVQVKGTGSTNPKGRYDFTIERGKASRRPLSADECDVLALVAVNIPAVVFRPASEYVGQTTTTVQQSEFRNLPPAATWARCLDVLDAR